MEGDFSPFCKLGNGSSVYVGKTYYVTWDTNFFTEKNATVLIQANFLNVSDGGAQAFQSPKTVNGHGYIPWTIDKEILRGKSWNKVTLFIVPLVPIANELTSFQGPTVKVTNRPAEYYRQPPPKAPKSQSLYSALPRNFGFIVICLCG
ncbi:hypothetical protein LSUB1_G000569 [Lachnellula subtilissima]|uniref:Uncharacterized protein n=1 Tax=Lachnellula subtilissima TaxID=602034 RepID=A0A8H8S1I1_9HELO|nr:hypothetical protein LSUB1_G000569 [Lachnellula subtilissima]